MSVNRTELIAAIAEKAGLTKTDADAFLGAFQDVLVENVAKGEAVKITGLMGIERVERAARTGRNPRTGEEMTLSCPLPEEFQRELKKLEARR